MNRKTLEQEDELRGTCVICHEMIANDQKYYTVERTPGIFCSIDCAIESPWDMRKPVIFTKTPQPEKP